MSTLDRQEGNAGRSSGGGGAASPSVGGCAAGMGGATAGAGGGACNLMEEKELELAVDAGRVALAAKPYEIVTLRVAL